MTRRFTPPWTVQDLNDACYRISDANGVVLAYVYYGDGGSEAVSRQRLSRDEARRIAANIAKLPELLQHDGHQTGETP